MSVFDERGRLVTSARDVEVSSLPLSVEQNIANLSEANDEILVQTKVSNLHLSEMTDETFDESDIEE